jgi:hypothetical protein
MNNVKHIQDDGCSMMHDFDASMNDARCMNMICMKCVDLGLCHWGLGLLNVGDGFQTALDFVRYQQRSGFFQVKLGFV